MHQRLKVLTHSYKWLADVVSHCPRWSGLLALGESEGPLQSLGSFTLEPLVRINVICSPPILSDPIVGSTSFAQSNKGKGNGITTTNDSTKSGA